MNKILTFSVILILVVSFIIINNVYATASITISPTSGVVGTSVTITGKGYIPSSQNVDIPNVKGSTALGWWNNIWTNGPTNSAYISGLPGKLITNIAMEITDLGKSQQSSVVGGTQTLTGTSNWFGNIYTSGPSNGAYLSGNSNATLQSIEIHVTDIGENQSLTTIGATSTSGTNFLGNIYTSGPSNSAYYSSQPLATLQTLALNITDTGLGSRTSTLGTDGTGFNNTLGSIYTSSPSNCAYFPVHEPNAVISSVSMDIKNVGDGAGHIRIKIWNVTTGNPTSPFNLLGESGAFPITTTGLQTFSVTATMPKNGLIMPSFEADENGISVASNGSTCSNLMTHTFGSGPTTWTESTTSTNDPYMQITWSYSASDIRVKVFQTHASTLPGSLLAESSSFPITTTGWKNFTLPAGVIIPTNNTYFPAFETDNNALAITLSNQVSGSQHQCAHTFGSGPSSWCSVDTLNSQSPPYIKAYYQYPFSDIRLKIYNDTGCGTQPTTLIAETASTPITQTGMQNFTLPANTRIPANTCFYPAFETDNGNFAITTISSGLSHMQAHTFGSGPTTFSSATTQSTTPFMKVFWQTPFSDIRLKIYNDTGCGTQPTTLIGETNSIPLTKTGIQNFTLPANIKVPSNGCFFPAFETDNNLLTIRETNPQGNQHIQGHTYGTGPTTFSSVTLSSVTPYMETYYNTKPIPLTVKYDSTVMTTTPTSPVTNGTGGFSGLVIIVTSATGSNPHTVTVLDNGTNSATAPFTLLSSNVSFRPLLYDGQTQLTSGKLLAIQSGAVIASATTNSTGWANLPTLQQGTYNFTITDDKNFVVWQSINYNLNGNVNQAIATNDYPVNCVGSFGGYQSDLILRINDTTGTHITNISNPDCSSKTDVKWSETFTGNGQSGNTFVSSMLTSVSNSEYQINAQLFTVNGITVPTIFSGNTNLISQSFTVGSGSATTTLNFDITLGQVAQINNPTGSPNPSPTSPSQGVQPTCSIPNGCTTSQQCLYGINPDGTCFDPSTPSNEGNPQTCPAGTNLVGNQCIAPQICNDGSTAVNGQCPNNQPPQCPAGTNLVNGQCIAPPPPPNSQSCQYGVNPDGTCQSAPTLDQCNANPALCNPVNNGINQLLGGGGAGSNSVTVNGLTYTPTVDVLQLGQIKNEVIGVSWGDSSTVVIAQLYFLPNATFGINPTPMPPLNLTGSITGISSGSINYVLTVPSNYCSNTVTTNCINPNTSTFSVPVSVIAFLDGKEIRNTIFLKITVLAQQTIATYLIIAIAVFALLGIVISRIKNKKKSQPRRNVSVKTPKRNNSQYLSKK